MKGEGILTLGKESISGETVWPVPILSLPDPEAKISVQELMGAEAVRLFVDRARSRLPGFELTQENARSVATICRDLDGLPLAIELSTARMGALAVEQVAERLEDSLKLLTGGDRTVAPRHQTLRATLDWSYELLSEPERRLFGRLSVFASGWTLEAAEAVGAGEGIEEGEVLDLLSRLVNKSMVVVEAAEDRGLRYGMLEPVRQYGQELLAASGEADAVRRRHASWYFELAKEVEPWLRGARQEVWLERLEREYGNLRAALGWALERGETELGLWFGGALGEFWYLSGYLSEGHRWLEAALASCPDARKNTTRRRNAMEALSPEPDMSAIKERQQKTWTSGNYAMVGNLLVSIGEQLCEAVDLRAGDKVLDVATGSGNTALSAARRFCKVTGIDYVPELVEQAESRAEAERLEVRFEMGDAEDLPYADASFDVVLSTLGVMFTPDQEKAAGELLRVCRSGGKIGLANWTPDGFIGSMFRTMGRHVPPPPGIKPPPLWGTEERLQELLGEGVSSLETTRRSYVFRFPSAGYFVEYFRDYYGPTLKAFESLDATGRDALARDLQELLEDWNTSGDETLVVASDYLEAVAVRR